MKSIFRGVWATAAAIACVALLSSCSRLLPTFVMIGDDESLSFATCSEYADVTSVKLRLTNPVEGEARSFEENVVTFSGPAVSFSKGESLELPAVAEGWTSDVYYSEVADWTHASISFITSSGGGSGTDTFARSELRIGEWTQLGENSEGCEAPH